MNRLIKFRVWDNKKKIWLDIPRTFNFFFEAVMAKT